ncbi:hypothetical protein BGZ95_006973 [Linnemannia exigua]|uniref:Uncharacterized protein n=1 Tax=Linnemannia exigua TaxID=604196 RepID=A0AAD4H0K7_9FUNG|nr:hypothetical protein BGZ95_006973 [Linnemannia exigua]
MYQTITRDSSVILTLGRSDDLSEMDFTVKHVGPVMEAFVDSKRASSRFSSKQTSSAAGSTLTSNPDSPEQATNGSPEHSFDSTHQSNEATLEKSDQQLEATEPDISTNCSESSTADQVKDAVGTPINTEIQEEEPVSKDSGAGGMLAVQEEDSNPESKAHSIQLAGHIKGVSRRSKHLHHDSEHEQHHNYDQNTTTSASKDVESNTEETNRHGHSQHSSSDKKAIQEAEELDLTKYAKRTADDQAQERHDYLAGAYKSPFRHTHKVEKVGHEEL